MDPCLTDHCRSGSREIWGEIGQLPTRSPGNPTPVYRIPSPTNGYSFSHTCISHLATQQHTDTTKAAPRFLRSPSSSCLRRSRPSMSSSRRCDSSSFTSPGDFVSWFQRGRFLRVWIQGFIPACFRSARGEAFACGGVVGRDFCALGVGRIFFGAFFRWSAGLGFRRLT